MTLSAQWNENGHVVVRCTSGPVTFEVVEDKGGAAAFWSDLGRILAQHRPHAVAQAQLGYERYMEHCAAAGEAVDSDWSWHKLDDSARSHWMAVFGG